MSKTHAQGDRIGIWFTATGEQDGKPLIFRGRQHLPAAAAESDYPMLVNIHWPYASTDENGMPDENSNAAQTEFEDALAELDVPGVSVLVLVVTGNGRKVWHWYVSDVAEWMSKLNAFLAGHPPYPIMIENSHEPDWSFYHSFMSGVDGP